MHRRGACSLVPAPVPHVASASAATFRIAHCMSPPELGRRVEEKPAARGIDPLMEFIAGKVDSERSSGGHGQRIRG